MKTKRRYRRTIVRGGRRYVLCGPRAAPAKISAVKAPAAGVWLPGATFVLVLLFSAYIIGRPLVYPLAERSPGQPGSIARFTIDDFVNASR
jgi:hypothetical protein